MDPADTDAMVWTFCAFPGIGQIQQRAEPQQRRTVSSAGEGDTDGRIITLTLPVSHWNLRGPTDTPTLGNNEVQG